MTNYEIELVDLQEQQAAVVRGSVAPQGGIPNFLGNAFVDVLTAIKEQGNTPVGPPFARYRPTETGFDVEAGFPCRHPLRATGSRVQPTVLPRTRAVRVLHVGDYAKVEEAYRAIESWMVDNGYVGAAEPWETYLDDPDTAEPRTVVFHPCTEAGQPAATAQK